MSKEQAPPYRTSAARSAAERVVNTANMAAVVLAAGGTQRGSFSPHWADLLGRPVCAWVVDVLEAAPRIRELALVVPASRLRVATELRGASGWRKVRLAAAPPRASSSISAMVHAGLAALDSDSSTIVIQDGTHPLLGSERLAAAVRAADGQWLILTALHVTETIKWTDTSRMVRWSPPRESLRQLRTPVIVPRPALEAALGAARQAPVSDAAVSVVEWLLNGRAEWPIRLVPAGPGDLLVRQPDDLAVAADLLRARITPLSAGDPAE